MLVRNWSMSGLSGKEIAKKIGIAEQTLYDWCNRFPTFSESLRVGRDCADAIVENELFKLAKAGNFPAIKYWLTCRKPDKWNEKVVAEKASSVIYDTEDTSDIEALIYGE